MWCRWHHFRVSLQSTRNACLLQSRLPLLVEMQMLSNTLQSKLQNSPYNVTLTKGYNLDPLLFSWTRAVPPRQKSRNFSQNSCRQRRSRPPTSRTRTWFCRTLSKAEKLGRTPHFKFPLAVQLRHSMTAESKNIVSCWLRYPLDNISSQKPECSRTFAKS